MRVFSNIIQKRVLYLVGFIFVMFMLKPRFFYKPNGKPREYGLGYDHEGYKKTLYSVQFIILVVAIFLSFLFNERRNIPNP